MSWEADFAVSCSQCGGQEFEQLFPVPAVVYRRYAGARDAEPAEVVVSTYACVQCGHLEHFAERPEGEEDTSIPPAAGR